MSAKASVKRAKQRAEKGAARRTLGSLHLDAADALTAGTLIDGARMYAASADAINARLPFCVFPISHLLCTSIELSLKAFLRLHGGTEDELMDLGHDLPKLFERAVAFGMRDTGSRQFVLLVAGANYKERLFVYPEQGLMHSIATWRLRSMCHEILVEVFSAINGPEMLASMSTHPGLCVQGEYREVPTEAIGGWTGIHLGPLGCAALAPTPATAAAEAAPLGNDRTEAP